MSEKKLNSWIYDGTPDNIGLIVPDANPGIGGYIVLAQLHNGEVRLFATRYPTRCVVGWKSQVRKFGGQDFTRVMVSTPHIRYERIKRMIVESGEDEGCRSIQFYRDKVVELFEVAAHSHAVPAGVPA
ncbi:hypothetical protein [Diaphorobacter sp. J5-51]|uniref:hypothetical protein n=1 Tax=Diaphorobacter sp. J5-51 TaxID=680496 RepID=UPI000643A24E|nr:hypothetical protein [Diaphorobacter sp. J5-51]KLR58976.1 hypothetical protein OX89_04085 [Diaphorobacter sp. J5-51]